MALNILFIISAIVQVIAASFYYKEKRHKLVAFSPIAKLDRVEALEDTRLPHEKYPKLQYWEIGDEFTYGGEEYRYLGMASDQLCVKFLRPVEGYNTYKVCGTPYKWSLDAIQQSKNRNADEREVTIESAKIQQEIDSDPYNDFLKELRKVQQEYVAELPPAKVTTDTDDWIRNREIRQQFLEKASGKLLWTSQLKFVEPEDESDWRISMV